MTSSNITIYSSPDADDIFMMYGLMSGAIQHANINFIVEMGDIEELNKGAFANALQVSAVSAHALAYISTEYDVLCSGASFAGRTYGPLLVSTKNGNSNLEEIKKIAIPGEFTSAALALRIYLSEHSLAPELVPVSFHNVHEAVLSGAVDAGVLIHEGQLIHERQGLQALVNLGTWWWETRELLLPLGMIAIRKNLGTELESVISNCVRQSIQYAHNNRSAALNFAKEYRRGLSLEELDKYVNMYANETSIDMGSEGRRSLELFLAAGHQFGLLANAPKLNFV